VNFNIFLKRKKIKNPAVFFFSFLSSFISNKKKKKIYRKNK